MSAANLEAAKILLATCERGELVDQTFGDKEVTWSIGERLVAEGYFSFTEQCVTINLTDVFPRFDFEGKEARELEHLGTLERRERNDSGGGVLYQRRSEPA